MPHSQPNAITLLGSGYADVKSAIAAILLEADEIIVKPFEARRLVELLHEKISTRKPTAPPDKERVAAILQRCANDVVEDWLAKVRKSKKLSCVSLSDEERTGYLPKLIEDLIVRPRASHNPREESESIGSAAAVAHGEMRKLQATRLPYPPGVGCSRDPPGTISSLAFSRQRRYIKTRFCTGTTFAVMWIWGNE